ncbi:MAG: DUF1330 domain-containing protein [Actinobacteria bacterium]|nr:MAG: DUF1330 domain-containing protein [Actinomycetota bacterium]
MPAYLIADVHPTDPQRAATHSELAEASVERHGGRYLARGGALTVLEGNWEPERVTIIEFPSTDAARAWFESEHYGPARDARQGAGSWQMVVVDGV